MKKILTPHALERLKARVKAAESKTSGEIVPLIVPRSQSLGPVRATLLLAGLMLGWACVVVENLVSPFQIPFSWIMSTLSGGLALGFILAFIPYVLRLVLGPERLARRAHEAALAAFVREGVSATKERSGVLIFVSLFEHRVEVVADTGIHQKVGPETWVQISNEIALGFKTRTPVEALEAAIDRVGSLLAQHFPGSHSDKNELSDDVRVRE